MSEPGLIDGWLVRIELQRIQTFLFSVPRLRAMLGANALLGHAMRHALPALSRGGKVLDFPDLERPPDWDPLSPQGDSTDLTSFDDPRACYHRGILSRDGGHLRIVFENETDAKRFVREVRSCLAEKLPDLPYAIRVDEWSSQTGPNEHHQPEPPPTQLPELPQFQGCTGSGYGVAAHETSQDEKPAFLSVATKSKLDAGKGFLKRGKADAILVPEGGFRDQISLLRKHLPGYVDLEPPRDLEDLSDAGNYIALIHADGNRVGQRINAYRKSQGLETKSWIERERATEGFFRQMRAVVRASLIGALEETFTEPVLARHAYLPYQLLMLGGDDLLVVCQPCYALPFITAFAKGLGADERALPDDKPLSIGAGVVIARHSLPFHRLHQLAEDLAGSAKRAYLQTVAGEDEPRQRSVVDWMVLTSSWGEDPDTYRARYDVCQYPVGERGCGETLALTAKPYFILDGDAPGLALERMLTVTDALAEPDEHQPIPRSQLKDLVAQLPQGRRWAQLCFEETLERLPKDARESIETHIAPGGQLWCMAADGYFLTHMRDLVELTELRFLGRRKQDLERGVEVRGGRP